VSTVLFLIELVVLGSCTVWLLALAPAAALTVLKGQWRSFVFGFLTAGFLWFASALSLAPPDSRWARRFYGPAQLARAKRPFRDQRSPLTLLLWTAASGILIVALGFVILRPAPIVGVNGKALGNSVPGRGGGIVFEVWPHLGPCQRHGAHSWDCTVYDDEGSGGTLIYRVQVDRLGCWKAWPTERGGVDRYAGCLTAFDYF
jgi:hypothetical protein